MRHAPVGILLLAMLVIGSGCAATMTDTETGSSYGGDAGGYTPGSQVSIDYFYNNLADDGDWFQDPNNGWCWTPYDVSADWRPYSNGHWEYTDYGWSWVSSEPFGWATYHYGRWFFDSSYGWAWQPGTEWAPAWVAWRTDDYDDVGWAPLPPRATWDVSVGLTYGNADNDIPWDEWCFVPREHLMDVNLSVVVTPAARNVTLLQRSHDATRFEVRQGRPANVGPDVAQLESATGRRIPRERIQDADSPGHARGRGSDGTVNFFRPRFQPMPAAQAMPAPSMAGRGAAIPDADLQRERDQRQRKLEADLGAERNRLAAVHARELVNPPRGEAADDVRKRHEAEQQAFEQHAAQQRQVLEQRFQKHVMRQPNAGNRGRGRGKPDNADNGNGNGKGNGHDNGNGQ